MDIQPDSPLHCLPDEMLRNIFAFMSSRELFSISRVSRKFHRLAFELVTDIDFMRLHSKRPDEVLGILSNFPNLLQLDLTDYCGAFYHFVSDHHLKHVLANHLSENCPKLRALQVPEVSGVEMIEAYAQQLKGHCGIRHVKNMHPKRYNGILPENSRPDESVPKT